MLPAHNTLLSIETSSQLTVRLDDLALQNSVLDDILAVLWSDSRKPYTLRRLAVVPRLAVNLAIDRPRSIGSSIDHHVGAVFVAADV